MRLNLYLSKFKLFFPNNHQIHGLHTIQVGVLLNSHGAKVYRKVANLHIYAISTTVNGSPLTEENTIIVFHIVTVLRKKQSELN